jgi:hypothetical protein
MQFALFSPFCIDQSFPDNYWRILSIPHLFQLQPNDKIIIFEWNAFELGVQK